MNPLGDGVSVLLSKPPAVQSEAIDGLEALLRVLPAWIQEAAEENLDGLEELALDLGRPLTLSCANSYRRYSRCVGKDDLHYLIHRLGGFREDNRAGLEGTLHRISAIRDRYGEITGATIRLGRFLVGVAEPLREVLLSGDESLMLIGPPGAGKTTLLRDVVRILAEAQGPKVVVVDTSNEIGGDGKTSHPGLAAARRLQVPDPSLQAKVLMEALANHGPECLVIDELGYRRDVENAVTIVQRGVKMVATVHGRTLAKVVHNPDLVPLLGGLDTAQQRRLSLPVFSAAVEVRGKGQLYYFENLEEAVDSVLMGKKPRGRWLAGAA